MSKFDPNQMTVPVTTDELLEVFRDWFKMMSGQSSCAWPSMIVQNFDFMGFMLDQIKTGNENARLKMLQRNEGPVAQAIRHESLMEDRLLNYRALTSGGGFFEKVIHGDDMVRVLAPFLQPFSMKRAFHLTGKYFEIDTWGWHSRHVQQEFTPVEVENAQLTKSANGAWTMNFQYRQHNGCVVYFHVTPKDMSFSVSKVINTLEGCEHYGTQDNIDLDWYCDKMRELMLAAGWDEQLYESQLVNQEKFEQELQAVFDETPLPEGMSHWSWESTYSSSYRHAPYIEEIDKEGRRKWSLHTRARAGENAADGNLFRCDAEDHVVLTVGEERNAKPVIEIMHEMTYSFILEQVKKHRAAGIAKYIEQHPPKVEQPQEGTPSE